MHKKVKIVSNYNACQSITLAKGSFKGDYPITREDIKEINILIERGGL